MRMRYYAVAALMTAAAIGAFVWLLPQMPARVAIHWNVHGQVDRLGPSWVLFLVGPGAMTLSMALFALTPWFSPRRFEVETFEKTYLELMLVVVALQAYVFGVLMWAATGHAVDVASALVGGICVVQVFMGNLLGKVRRNFFIGIRTPWTLASERVWYASHRLGAKTLVVSGLVAFALQLAGLPFWVALVVLGMGVLAPVVHSFRYYKRLEREGGLGFEHDS